MTPNITPNIIPKTLLDLGAAVVIVFVVLLIIKEIVKLASLLKSKPGTALLLDGDGNCKPKTPCIQSPMLQEIVQNQNTYVETTARLETIMCKLADNQSRQIFVLEALQKAIDKITSVQEQQTRMLDRMCIKLDAD